MARHPLMARLGASYLAGTTPDYIERLCTSWLLRPWVFFAVRTIIALYALVVVFFQVGWLCTHVSCKTAGTTFSFFTVLTYWGLALYYTVAATHTAVYASRGRSWLHNWPSGLKWLHSVFYATITVFPFIVTAVYWSVLAAGAFDSTYGVWSNMSQHGLNSLLAFLEILLPRSLPHPWLNVVMLVIILACYLALAYITHATQGFYVYSFLDPDWHGRGAVAGACVGILAATIVVFIVVKYLIWLRVWLTEKKFGMMGKFASSSASRQSCTSSVTETDVEMGEVHAKSQL